MARYLAAAVFLGATIWVGWYNRTHTGSKILMPFLHSLMPAATLQELGERTTQALGVAFGLVLLVTVVQHVQARRAARTS